MLVRIKTFVKSAQTKISKAIDSNPVGVLFRDMLNAGVSSIEMFGEAAWAVGNLVKAGYSTVKAAIEGYNSMVTSKDADAPKHTQEARNELVAALKSVESAWDHTYKAGQLAGWTGHYAVRGIKPLATIAYNATPSLNDIKGAAQNCASELASRFPSVALTSRVAI